MSREERPTHTKQFHSETRVFDLVGHVSVRGWSPRRFRTARARRANTWASSSVWVVASFDQTPKLSPNSKPYVASCRTRARVISAAGERQSSLRRSLASCSCSSRRSCARCSASSRAESSRSRRRLRAPRRATPHNRRAAGVSSSSALRAMRIEHCHGSRRRSAGGSR